MRRRDEMENKEYSPPNEAVLNCDRERMADVETPCDVWRRRRNHERFLILRLVFLLQVFGFEVALSKPPVVPCRFDRDGIIGLRHWPGHIYSRVI